MTEILKIKGTMIPKADGGIYNSSIFLYEKNYYIIGRCESIPENERSGRLFEEHSAILFKLDADFNISSYQKLQYNKNAFIGKYRIEDFRVFIVDNEIFVNHTLIFTYPFRRTTQVLSKLDIVNGTLTDVNFTIDYDIQKIEKNWVFFEHNSQIKLIYSISPFVILTADKKNLNFKEEKNEKNEINLPYYLSNSTNPIELNANYYLSFYHYRDDNDVYYHVPFLIDKNDLKFIEIRKTPIFSGGNCDGLRKNVLYLMSMLKLDNEIIFSFGEGDSQTLVSKTKIFEL